MSTINLQEGWYENGHLVWMLDDQGHKQETAIREAQCEIVNLESKALRNIGMDEDDAMKLNYEWFLGRPYQWTIQLLNPSDMLEATREFSSNYFLPLDENEVVVAQCGGGDSMGFGYNWIFDKKANSVWMSENGRQHSYKVGTIENVPASILSDIERIDKAIVAAVEIQENLDESGTVQHNIPIILDALSDARNSLLTMVERLNEQQPA